MQRLLQRQSTGGHVINWANFVSQLFNGLVLGALLALISSGLTIIYGTLGVLNLAHGAMFMLGGYAGWLAYHLHRLLHRRRHRRRAVRHAARRGDGAGHHPLFLFAAARGPAARHLRSRHRLRRGRALLLRQPVEDRAAAAGLAGITPLGFMLYPTYRLALLGIVVVALLALYVVLYRTRIGMIVRAGIEDSVMVDSLGIDVYKVFMLVFGIGAMAAGFAGIVNAPVVSITPDVGEAILVQTFVVVVIGGVGSFPGAVLGGLIAGEIISITSMFNPGYSYVMLFVAMTLVLVLRPYGLLGAAGRE